MSEVNVHQIVDTAGNFQNLANQHGGIFIAEGKHNLATAPGHLRYFSPPSEFRALHDITAQGAGIVPVRDNFAQLVAMPGREFGLLQPGVGIRPAVITQQSYPVGPNGQPGKLHIAFLTGERDIISPANIATGANDPLNGLLLQTANTLFGPTIGLHGEDGQVMQGELGHRFGGLRTISDPTAMQAVSLGVDITDALVAKKGLAVGITESKTDSGQDIPGAFDIVDDRGNVRRIPYATATLGPDSTAILIDHPRFNQDISRLLGGMSPAIAATGLAIIAKISRESPVDEVRAVQRYSEQALGL